MGLFGLSFLLITVLQLTGVMSSCPFAGSYSNGRMAQWQVEEKKAQLMALDYRIDQGDPAYIIFGVQTMDENTRYIYNQSLAMILAQQFYIEQSQEQENGHFYASVQDLFSEVQRSVPFEDRCQAQPKCDPEQRFVTSTGVCNNQLIPLQGASYTPYSRLLDASYEDGVFKMRKSIVSHRDLPSPRKIGNVAMQHSTYSSYPTKIPNHGSLLFGQYITHDFGFKDTFQDYSGGNGLRCCSKDNKRALPEQLSYYGCNPMEVPEDDPFYSQFGGGCLDYIRSQPIFGNDCQMGPAQIPSSVTQYIDQSNIYGSTDAVLQSVRSFVGGKMLINNGILARLDNCTTEFCYYTGDIRGSFYPTLTLWHSVFVRFHNLIADQLAIRNGIHWKDERLFQETRRILTAVYQNIVFNEWLPLYIGVDVATKRNVSRPLGSADDSLGHDFYDEHLDGSNMHEFNVGAFRLFHALTPYDVNMYDENYKLNETLPLSRSMHGPDLLERQYYGIMRGLINDPVLIGKYPNHIRDTVFGEHQANNIGMDLLSVDVMRGRDHGLRPYYEYLQLYSGGDRVITKWSDLHDVFSHKSIQLLSALYESVLDLDLLVGLLLEEKVGKLTGPVSNFLIEEQFYRAKFGNRFFYNLADNANRFTSAQLHQINRMRFANVLCVTTEIGQVTKNIFESIGPENPVVRCPKFMLDLDLWTENPQAPTIVTPRA